MNTLHAQDLAYRIAAEFSRRLRQKLGGRVHDVRVFGSRARGDARPDSDLDVFVLLDRYDRTTRNEILDLATDVGEDHDFAIVLSPLVMDESEYARLKARERRLVADIEREGVAL